MVKKDIAELHFDHQVWTDPVLPDLREHYRICNADGILPIAADGVVRTGNRCFLILGYGILLGAAPYAIAYLIKSCKDGIHPKWLAVLAGICQFFFSFDVLAMMVLTLKERHRVKTTIAVFCAMCLALLLIVLYVVMTLIGA